LPERSYDQLSSGLDAELIRGLIAVKHAGGLVVGMRLDAHGRPQRIHDLMLVAAGEEAVGLAYAPVDADGTARRLNASGVSASRAALPLLVDRAAQTLGIKHRAGIIDFACGQMFQYIPMQDVLGWASTDPQRLRMLTGKSVFIGKVGPDDDPMRQPLSLAAWDPSASEPPGVILLAQTLRALESGRILPTLPALLQIALTMLCACVVLIGGLWRTWSGVAAITAAVIAAVYAAYIGGLFIPPAALLLAIVLGATARSSFEAFEQRRFRLAIQRQFGGYVSPSVLDAMLAGEIDPSQPRQYANLAFLFADLRGFTPLTEAQPAEEVLTLLNRYYDAITPAIHRHEGTIDNFRGDGILAISGYRVRPAMRRGVQCLQQSTCSID